MKTSHETAEAGVIPNHIRIIDIDTSIDSVYWVFPEDIINYSSESICHIHSDAEYVLLNQKAEELFMTQPWKNIKVIIDVQGRKEDWWLYWYIHIYQCNSTWKSEKWLHKINSYPLSWKIDLAKIGNQTMAIIGNSSEHI